MGDEQHIRNLIQTWMDATKAGDIKTVLSLMTDDVVFLVAGREPFGKEVFRRLAESAQNGDREVQYEGESEIEELQVIGDWAFARSHLKVSTVPADGGMPNRRAGYTLTIFRKEVDGQWRLARDANLLTPVES